MSDLPFEGKKVYVEKHLLEKNYSGKIETIEESFQ